MKPKPFNLADEQKKLDREYMKERERGPLWQPKIQFNELEMMCLVSTMQLAMRHPVFPHRPTGQWCSEFIKQLIGTIPTDRPALRALMEAGNNPAFDEITGRK